MNCAVDLPLEQTEELSPGSPLSVPLSWSSLRSESPPPAGPGPCRPPMPPLLPDDARPCRDRSRGPSVDEAGDTGEPLPPPPLLRPLSDSMSVIMNLERPRWCRGMVPAADAAVSSCTVIAALPLSAPPVATAAASPTGHCCSRVALRPDTAPMSVVAVVTDSQTRVPRA